MGKSTKKLLLGGASFAVIGMFMAPALAQEQMETIVVTGQRAALESAQKMKQNSTEIVDSIVAEDIGKLPDRSITEVLQRVSGVTIGHTYTDIGGHTDPEHFAVEGNGVAVRGLTYVLSEINGRDSFTANGGRSLSFEDVSPELMAGVDVYKNPSASQIEGAIGGLVNLRTVMPLDIDGMRVSGSIGGSWGELPAGRIHPQGSVMFSDRWNTRIGEIGVLVDLAYSESATRTDGIEVYPYYPRTKGVIAGNDSNDSWIPDGQTVWVSAGGMSSWRSLWFNRLRRGNYAAVQWRPTENLETSFTFFRSSYKFHWDENGLFSQNDPYHIVPVAGTTFTTQKIDDKNSILVAGDMTNVTNGGVSFGDDTRTSMRHSVTSDYSWKTTWNVTDKLVVKSDLQMVDADTNNSDMTVGLGIQMPWQKFDLRGSLPTATVDQAYMTNPANYYWAFTMDGLGRAKGKEYSWATDAEYTFDGGFFKTLRVGGRIVDRQATTELSQPGNGYHWDWVTQTWALGWGTPRLAYLSEFPADSFTYTFPRFFNGKTSLPSNVLFPSYSVTNGWPDSFAKIQAIRTQLCGWCSWTPAALGDPSGVNKQHEQTYAGYAAVKFGSETMLGVPFDGEAGVRIVQTHDKAAGFYNISQYPSSGGSAPPGAYVSFAGASTPVNVSQNFMDVLPSLNLRFHLSDELQARFAVAKAISRPDFSSLQAYTSLGSSYDNTTLKQKFTGTANGNPNLKPTDSTQIDLGLEWYFSSSGHITGALFYKALHDVVINQVFSATANDTAGTAHAFTVTGPINGADGEVKGFEVDYQQYFEDYLPDMFKGLGMAANATFVDSHRDLYTPVTGKYCNATAGGETTGQTDNLNLNLNGCDTDGRTFSNLPLQQLSRWAYNVTLLYERGPVSGRMAYSWRSKYLMGVNVNPTQGSNGLNTDTTSATYGQANLNYGLPIYGAAYGTLDGGLFYKLGEHVTFGVEAQNILDATYKELMQQHIGFHTFAYYDSGRSFSGTVRITF